MASKKKLKTINIILFCDFVLLGLSGVFSRIIPYDIYRIIHPGAGYLLLILVGIHLYMNRKWIKSNF